MGWHRQDENDERHTGLTTQVPVQRGHGEMRGWVSSKLAIVKDLGQIQSGVDSIRRYTLSPITVPI
jgi:hypothetical protein